MQNSFIIQKTIGETPLEALERFRAMKISEGFHEFRDIPMTYAGRLDPMANGVMIVLVGEECKNKEKYLSLDKEYVVEILFGVSTDTQDTLGLITNTNTLDTSNLVSPSKIFDFSKYLGKFIQKYPAYSSKTVNGRQLHEYARADELPEEMPAKEVEIYEIEKINERKLNAKEIVAEISANIAKVKGDFRQEKIIEGWKKFSEISEKTHEVLFDLIKIRAKCASGTYMRTLAERIGKDVGMPALAYSIHRTKIYDTMSV